METLYKGRFLNMVQEGHWEYCERVNQTGAVMIFALTPDSNVILVEEYRPPIAKRSLCFPAGLSGDVSAESELESAHRELLEETGYRADKMQYLFTGPSSPGLTSECISFYLARDLQKVAEGGGVDNENIIVHEVPLDEIDAWLMQMNEANVAIDPRIYTGLYFFQKLK